jgi:hypothetical protein
MKLHPYSYDSSTMGTRLWRAHTHQPEENQHVETIQPMITVVRVVGAATMGRDEPAFPPVGDGESVGALSRTENVF